MKLEFSEITIDDKELITDLLGQNGDGKDGDISCERQFGTNFSWRMRHPVTFAQFGEGVLFRYRWENECLFRIKQPDIESFDNALKTLSKNCNTDNLKIINMTELEADFVKEKYSLEPKYNIDYSDYIYEAEKFRTYAGKKLHKKRNRLNKFMRLYGERYECKDITDDVIDDCYLLLDEWKSEKGTNGLIRHEIVAVDELLSHYFELDLLGCCLYVDDKPIGFTIGEPLYRGSENSTLVIHGEKASFEYDGAYPALANLFALKHPDFKYINREDDVGDEGLRKSKRSYIPLKQIHKYMVEIDTNFFETVE